MRGDGARPKTVPHVAAAMPPSMPTGGARSKTVPLTPVAASAASVVPVRAPVKAPDFVGPYVSAYPRRSRSRSRDRSIPRLMALVPAPSHSIQIPDLASTESMVRPGHHTQRPIMRDMQKNLKGIWANQISCGR